MHCIAEEEPYGNKVNQERSKIEKKSQDQEYLDPPDSHGWRQEGKDLIQGMAAGAIVGIPLIYTMEMWWKGMTSSEWHLLGLMAMTLVVVFCFSLFSGFRQQFTWGEAVSESISAVGLSLLFSFALLWLIHEITFQMQWRDILGRVIVQTFPVSLGVAFANRQVREKTQREEHQPSNPPPTPPDPQQQQFRQDLKDAAATLGGASIFALSIAPTEEVVLIAARTPAWQHLVIMAASLLLCHAILFASDFQQRPVFIPSLAQNPWMETAVAYALSLLVVFALLYFLGMSEGLSHTSTAAKAVVTLGLPAVVGGAAGRLII